MSCGMRLPSLRFRAFEEMQYKHVYLKRLHELLNNYSERTLADIVGHISSAIV